jgi:hypothetical protein
MYFSNGFFYLKLELIYKHKTFILEYPSDGQVLHKDNPEENVRATSPYNWCKYLHIITPFSSSP